MDISEEDVDSIKAMFGHIHQYMEKQREKEDLVEMTQLYNKWGRTYDKHFCDYYGPPIYCAEALIRHLAGQTDVRILDVAAGTGAVGAELRKQGFTNIDAVEPSTGMMAKGKEKNVYNKIYTEYFTDKVDYIETDTYDVVVTSGAFGPGHLNDSCLPEIVRITKAGGLVVLSVIWLHGAPTSDPGPLEKAGKWKQVEEHQIQKNYYFEEDKGTIYILKITK